MHNTIHFKISLLSKELFGGKKKLVFFIVFSIVVYTMIAIQVVLSEKSTDKTIVPDIVFTGAPSGNTITYEKYGEVRTGAAAVITDKLNGKARSYELIERNIITVQRDNSLESITYSLFACPHEFFSDILSSAILEGRIPEEGKREAIVGGYLAKAFDIKIGDYISKKGVYLKDLGTVDIVLDLSGNYQEIEYEIVGVLNNTNAYFDYTILLGDETQAGIKSNQVWTYFIEDSAVDEYLHSFVNADSIFFSEYGIASVSETYRSKDTGIASMVLKNIYLFIMVIVFCIIEVAYLLKGVSYKLGVMKAVGISNRYIYNCYFVGVLIIQTFSFIFSLIAMHVICGWLNNMISDAYGFKVEIYSITLTQVIIISLVFVIMLLTFWLSLWYRVNHVKPKVAMNTKV